MKKILFAAIISLIFLTSCADTASPDIINPDAEYLYFFGATCPHCQELNSKVQEEDLFSKIAVEKREVYFNNGNRERFLALTKKLKIENAGVPFVYDKVSQSYAIGVEDALKMFKNRLDTITSE